ncbi:hypothetical protein [Microbispora siamensis]|nr:hypothetical protein [Microbispora siamensis]
MSRARRRKKPSSLGRNTLNSPEGRLLVARAVLIVVEAALRMLGPS